MDMEGSGGMKVGRKATVIKNHISGFPEPLAAKAGEVMTIGDRESEFSGWVWCSDSTGKSGWVPQNYIEMLGPSARLIRDYDATELTVSEGDELILLEEESGWVWCRTVDDRYGWIPATAIREI